MSVFRKRSKSDSQVEYHCSIRFLDDTETIQVTFKKDTLGQWLFDRVCEKLNLLEKDYFGLRYVDADNQRHWLDPLKTVHKQLKGLSKMVCCFRVKYYPDEPMKLHEEVTRYYLFLQLRRDLHHGRLLCSHEEAIQMAAYVIQSEVGDYDPQDHEPGYVSKFKMLPKQTAKHEERIMDAHKALAGEVPSDSETNFLKRASSLDTYGVDPHQVKDQKGDLLYLGVTYRGIMTFRGSRRTQLFSWSQVRRLAYEGKMFIVHHSNAEKPIADGFKCGTSAGAKYLWRSAVEQQLFFTLSTSTSAQKVRSGGTLFSRGSKFRFSGRCQNEAYEYSEKIVRSEPAFNRTSSLPNFGKKTQNVDSKNNTMRESVLSDSFKEEFKSQSMKHVPVYLASGKNREEAAVDVPNILVNNAPVNFSTSAVETLVEGGEVKAPLASEEETAIVEEKMEQAASIVVNAAPPKEFKEKSKENGQVVREKEGILETSIDETLPYEPNRTMEESDESKEDEDEEEDSTADHPGLDEQIAKLDEEISNPALAEELNLSVPTPAASKTVEPVKTKKGGGVVKALTYSLLISLLLALILFYIIFFSSVKHPLVPKLRQNLKFLEPVASFVGQKATKMVTFFKKK